MKYLFFFVLGTFIVYCCVMVATLVKGTIDVITEELPLFFYLVGYVVLATVIGGLAYRIAQLLNYL